MIEDAACLLVVDGGFGKLAAAHGTTHYAEAAAVTWRAKLAARGDQVECGPRALVKTWSDRGCEPVLDLANSNESVIAALTAIGASVDESPVTPITSG